MSLIPKVIAETELLISNWEKAKKTEEQWAIARTVLTDEDVSAMDQLVAHQRKILADLYVADNMVNNMQGGTVTRFFLAGMKIDQYLAQKSQGTFHA